MKKDTQLLFKMINKKALSTVIATVLIILLVTAATAIVWSFVNNIIKERTEGVQSCFDVEASEKVTLDGYYTCFNPTEGEVQFSIIIEDAEIDGLVISISAGGSSKSFTLTNEETVVPNLKPYKGNYEDAVKLPGKKEGNTYVAKGFIPELKVDWIKIAPVIGEKQCGASDSTYQIDDCSLFVN